MYNLALLADIYDCIGCMSGFLSTIPKYNLPPRHLDHEVNLPGAGQMLPRVLE